MVMKELGKELNKNQLWKIAKNMFLTRHAQMRLAERTNLCGETLSQTLENVNKAIMNCKFAYNNNDGTISIVLDNELTIIVSYDDAYKKWHIATFKEPSMNGFSCEQKWELTKTRTSRKYKNCNNKKMHDYKQEKEFKAKKPYKRDKRWKGEY